MSLQTLWNGDVKPCNRENKQLKLTYFSLNTTVIVRTHDQSYIPLCIVGFASLYGRRAVAGTMFLAHSGALFMGTVGEGKGSSF